MICEFCVQWTSKENMKQVLNNNCIHMLLLFYLGQENYFCSDDQMITEKRQFIVL